MRHELSTLELLVLTEELNAVKGYHIDQFYQLGENRFRIKLSSKEGKINLNMEIPNYVALSNSGEISEEATGFAMAARKRLSGAKITGVSLLNNDRIIRIEFDRKESGGSIILEMFGRGNLIIADSKMEISLALQSHEFSDRTVRKAEAYKPPKNEAVNLRDKDAIRGVFDSVKGAPGGDKLIAYLSRRLGVGTMYLEDAIKKQGLDPKVKIKDVEKPKLDRVMAGLEEVVEKAGKAILYVKDGKPEDVAVAEIGKYSDLEKREMPLNEAIEALYSASPRQEDERNEDVERLEASLAKQDEVIKRMREEEQECRVKGDFISANVAQIGGLIKAAAIKNLSEEEISKAAGKLRVKRIDRAKRVIIIEEEKR